ncbi:hypothetical protein KKC97_04310 [bacterium]|nr:hypothetical protein [bacterium]
MICAAVALTIPAMAEPVESPLTPLVQTANGVLAGEDNSGRHLTGLIQQLLNEANANPSDSLYAEAIYLSLMLYDSLDVCDFDRSLCERLIQDSPASPFTKAAFDKIWNDLTDTGANPTQGSEFALEMALEANGKLSCDFFRIGFDPYVDEGLWNLAIDAGVRYLHSIDDLYDPELYIEVAGVMLKAGESDRSIELMNELVTLYPKHPCSVRGRTELGLIHLALSNNTVAQDHFSQAWSTYQKYRKKDGFQDHEVVYYAARALWESQEHSLNSLKRKLDDRISTRDKLVRRDQSRLEKTYELIMQTDPSFSAQCWMRIGDLNLAFAEAHLREDYETIQVGKIDEQRNPYDNSLEYYDAAQAAYEKAASSASPDLSSGTRHWSELRMNWNSMALHNRYDVFAREADVVYTWAMDVWKHAPERSLGEEGFSKRFEMLVDRVFPLVRESLYYRQFAFATASQHPTEFKLNETWNKLEQDMNGTLKLATDLCQTQWDATSATAIQLSKTLQITGNPAAVRTMRETLINQLEHSESYWKEGQSAIADLFDSYLACRPRTESRGEWENELMQFHYNFAAMAGSSGMQVESSTANLDHLDPIAQTLKQRLRSMAKDAARAEEAALIQALEMAARFNINNEAFANIYGRLREMNPAQYPSLEVYRASRK